LYNPASIGINASIAETYASKGEPEHAIRYARINLNYQTGNKWSDTEVPGAILFDDDYQGYKNTLSLAKYYLARYKKQENFTDLVMSLSFSNLSDTLISHYRDATLIGGNDELLAEDYHRIAEVGIQAGYEAYLLNPQSEYLDNYLQFITQSTAYKLNAEVNQVGSKNAEDTRQIELLQEIRMLQNQLFALQNQQDSLQQKILNDQLFADRIEAFELSYELQQRKGVARSNELFSKISTSAIQLHLVDGEALAMYFMGRDQVFSVLVEKEGVRVAAIRRDEEFDKTLTGYYRGIKTTSPDFNEMATAMYRLLMAPFGESLTNIKSLTIVPDGALIQVPFEAFVNPSNQHFLIEDMAVSYGYSVFLWIRNHTVVNVMHELTFAGFAPVFSTETNQIIQNDLLVDAGLRDADSAWRNGKNLRPLPFSKDEVIDIAQLFTSKGYRSVTFLNNDASEENFKNNVQQFDIVHIATHGISSYTNPELSGLFFDQSNLDTTDNLTNDGFMFADEIYTLPIKADLVVLSACKTGAGKLAEGEGVLALPRGFLFSGVPNLVVSLWKIHDQKTKDLMVDFYTNVLGGQTYARALQQAKIKQIKQAQLPMDWSGIVLIGE
jgi:CHAT domain-containing protein